MANRAKQDTNHTDQQTARLRRVESRRGKPKHSGILAYSTSHNRDQKSRFFVFNTEAIMNIRTFVSCIAGVEPNRSSGTDPRTGFFNPALRSHTQNTDKIHPRTRGGGACAGPNTATGAVGDGIHSTLVSTDNERAPKPWTRPPEADLVPFACAWRKRQNTTGISSDRRGGTPPSGRCQWSRREGRMWKSSESVMSSFARSTDS